MPSVLICATRPVHDELVQGFLGRAEVDRYFAPGFQQGAMMALAGRPELVVIDRDLDDARRLVLHLRADNQTRALSIAIVARGDFDTSEVDLLEAGANAVVRLPLQAEGADRLARLMEVPVRRQVRMPAMLAFEGTVFGLPEQVAGTILDVSVSGVQVEATEALKIGAEIEIAFALPHARIRGRGRVVRLAGTGRYGISFDEVAADGVRHLQQFIDSAAAR